MNWRRDSFEPVNAWWGQRERKPKAPSKPPRKVIGTVFGFLKLTQIETRWSVMTDEDIRTGWCWVKCMACDSACERCHGKPYRMRLSKLSFTVTSKTTCGCLPGPKVEHVHRGGRKPQDITGVLWGKLEAIKYVPQQGWTCICTCRQVVEGVKSWDLVKGKRKACPRCSASHRKGARKPSRLLYLRPAPSAPVPDSQSSSGHA